MIISRILSILVAILLLQTLFFKFSAAPESVAIFTKLGVEPWGRILTGVIELLISILILIPATRFWGSAGAAALMVGALLSHYFVLGFAGDNLGLSIMAGFILLASIVILFKSKNPLS